MLKLKDDVAWEVIDNYGDFRERCTISGVDEIPEDLQWYSYWRTVSRTGFIESIEINKATREIKCQGCLDILFDMIQDGLVEKRPLTEAIFTTGGFYSGSWDYKVDCKIL